MQLLSWQNRERIRKGLEAFPTWSALRSLGQSRLLAFTALVPFLGSLILFNQQLVDLLLVSPSLVGSWTGAPDQNSEAASRAFTLSRLQLTYFGLCFLGIASFIFAIRCPAEIKRSPTISEYIETEKPLITSPRTGLLVYDVAKDFLENQGDVEASGPRFLRDMAYTVDQMSLFDSVFREISENMEWAENPHLEESPPIDGEKPREPGEEEEPVESVEVEMGLITMSGEYHSERVARVIYSRRRAEKAFWSTFEHAARTYLTDLLALRYLALDHSSRWLA